jgi:hypothetical protein
VLTASVDFQNLVQILDLGNSSFAKFGVCSFFRYPKTVHPLPPPNHLFPFSLLHAQCAENLDFIPSKWIFLAENTRRSWPMDMKIYT